MASDSIPNKDDKLKELKEIIDNQYNEKPDKQEILGKRFGISQATVSRWIRKYLKMEIQSDGYYKPTGLDLSEIDQRDNEMMNYLKDYVSDKIIKNPNVYVIPIDDGHAHWIKHNLDIEFSDVIITSIATLDTLIIYTDPKREKDDDSFDNFYKKHLKKMKRP